MTDTEIIKAVAELDGFVSLGCSSQDFGREQFQGPKGNQCLSEGNIDNGIRNLNGLPRYLTSRDAIVPVIEKQDEWIQHHFVEMLQDTKEEISVIKLLLATPRQLCEALLRATGKWKE